MNQELFKSTFNRFNYLVNRASLSSSILKLTLRVRPFLSCPMPLFQSEAECGLKVRIFRTRKWSTIYYLLLLISNLELFDNCVYC